MVPSLAVSEGDQKACKKMRTSSSRYRPCDSDYKNLFFFKAVNICECTLRDQLCNCSSSQNFYLVILQIFMKHLFCVKSCIYSNKVCTYPHAHVLYIKKIKAKDITISTSSNGVGVESLYKPSYR